jgi:NADH-quinone oxidoreductase subunit C
MSATPLAARVLAPLIPGLVVRDDFTPALVVPPPQWLPAARSAREHPELRADFFDVLTVVDEGAGGGADGGFRVVLHLYSVSYREHVFLETRLPALEPRVDSLTGVFAGAGWHEREAWEMFGVLFDGHPDLRPLLLPDDFEGHPLRKDFVLQSRVTRPWPGAVEPGGEIPRRRLVPPGVLPAPGTSPPAPGTGPVSGTGPTPGPSQRDGP